MTDTPLRERPLGDSQRYMLRELSRDGDENAMWCRGCNLGRWENDALTIWVLERLVLDGYAERGTIIGNRDTYKLTAKGHRKASELSLTGTEIFI